MEHTGCRCVSVCNPQEQSATWMVTQRQPRRVKVVPIVARAIRLRDDATTAGALRHKESESHAATARESESKGVRETSDRSMSSTRYEAAPSAPAAKASSSARLAVVVGLRTGEGRIRGRSPGIPARATALPCTYAYRRIPRARPRRRARRHEYRLLELQTNKQTLHLR